MHTGKFLLFALLAAVTLSVSAEEKLRVLDQGLDGNQRIYMITCPDGSVSTVIQVFNFDAGSIPEISPESREARISSASVKPVKVDKVCIYTKNTEACRPQWELDAAAEASCR